MLDRAKRTRLETELVPRPRPNRPLLMLLAVFLELFALVAAVLVAPPAGAPAPEVAPEARRLATAANVSRRLTALGSALAERLGTDTEVSFLLVDLLPVVSFDT